MWTNIVLVGYSVVADRLDDLLALHPDALVLDEAHYAKDRHARRSKALLTLADALPADGLRLALSGTPMPAGPRDLATQLEILGVLGAIAPSRRAFEERYCGGHLERIRVQGGGTRMVWQADGATHLDELSEVLAETCLVRRRKADVLDLPARTVADRPLPRTVLDAGDRRAIAEAEREVVKSLQRRLGAVLASRGSRVPCWDDCLAAAGSVRGQGISLTSGVRQALGMAKIPAVMEIVEEEAGAGRPIVVMAHHRAVQERIAQEATDAGYRVARITGDQAAEARTEAIDDFQAGRTQVMVASLMAAGVGISLHAASDVVIAELPWTAAQQDQAIDRVHRIGQTRKVMVYRLVATDTIEEKVMALKARKAKLFASVLGGDGFESAALRAEDLRALLSD
jgi:SNF2 family DNA or RNA helicase